MVSTSLPSLKRFCAARTFLENTEPLGASPHVQPMDSRKSPKRTGTRFFMSEVMRCATSSIGAPSCGPTCLRSLSSFLLSEGIPITLATGNSCLAKDVDVGVILRRSAGAHVVNFAGANIDGAPVGGNLPCPHRVAHRDDGWLPTGEPIRHHCLAARQVSLRRPHDELDDPMAFLVAVTVIRLGSFLEPDAFLEQARLYHRSPPCLP